MLYADDGTRLRPAPRRVAILGMGPTLQEFINLRLMNPQPGGVVDEVWGMNNVCTAVKCDVGFIMDDFEHMLERPHKEAKFWDPSNLGLMAWAREASIPIFTSRAVRPRYPSTLTYPLDDVLKSVLGERRGFHLSNTTSYAIAYAWHIGVDELHMYGTDFGYPWHDPYDRRRFLEAGRANVESLLLAGYLLGKFTFTMSAGTSLFDTKDRRPFYGYANGRLAIDDAMMKAMTGNSPQEKIDDPRALPAHAASGAAVSPEARGLPVNPPEVKPSVGNGSNGAAERTGADAP